MISLYLSQNSILQYSIPKLKVYTPCVSWSTKVFTWYRGMNNEEWIKWSIIKIWKRKHFNRYWNVDQSWMVQKDCSYKVGALSHLHSNSAVLAFSFCGWVNWASEM